MPRPLHILSADDDQDDCLLIERVLRRRMDDLRLEFVHDGVQLLARLDRKAGDRPDLILLDLNMPLMDGRESLKRIKSDPRLRHIPVMIFTTSSSDAECTECYCDGANAYLVKPDRAKDFASMADAAVDFWFDCAQLPGRGAR